MPCRFYLDNRPDKYGDHPIKLSWSVKGVRLLTTIGYSISPDKWIAEASSVKRGVKNGRNVPYNYINERISKLSSDLSSYEVDLMRFPSDVPSLNDLKTVVASSIGRSVSARNAPDIFPVIDEFIRKESSNKQWAENTIKKFGTMKNHLKEYNANLRFKDITEGMISEYVQHLADEKQMLDVSINKEIKLLKWFLKWAATNGYHKTTAYESFKGRTKMTKKPVIFLASDELIKVCEAKIPADGTELKLHNIRGEEYKKVVENHNSLVKCRDLFTFCCFTGLRYSDLANLRRTDIVDDTIRIVTQKTDDALIIELNTSAKAILEKYKDGQYAGLALPIISNQKMNGYIKDLAEICGITAPVTIVQYSNGKRITNVYQKWEVLSTHAGRRTFICSALAAGIPPQVIMKWTGHSDYQAMKPYIDVTETTKAESMKKLSEMFSR